MCQRRAGLVVRARAGTHLRRDAGLSAAACSRSGPCQRLGARSGSRARPLLGRRRGWLCGAGNPRIRGGRRPSLWPLWPSRPANPRGPALRDGTGLAEVDFPRKSCSRSRVRVSSLEPRRLVASSVAESFLLCGLKLAEATSCFVLFCFKRDYM